MSGIQLRVEAEVYNRIRRYHCVRGGARIMKVTSRSVVHLPEAVPILPDLAASPVQVQGVLAPAQASRMPASLVFFLVMPVVWPGVDSGVAD